MLGSSVSKGQQGQEQQDVNLTDGLTRKRFINVSKRTVKSFLLNLITSWLPGRRFRLYLRPTSINPSKKIPHRQGLI